MSQNLVRSLSTRSVKKLDKPKPLKSLIKGTDSSLSWEDILNVLNKTTELLVLKNPACDRELLGLTRDMLSKLRLYGPRLEENFEAQLDRAFVTFRNAAKGEWTQDINVRLNLLQLVELRAMQWQTTNNWNMYYSNGTHEGCDISDMTPPAEKANLTLSPGEVIKSSGKFSSPTKLPGKNYCRDEIVIRNADSGKVMGIKGRRVHMIEELSETVISFQRVNPGAKERLVQITGPEDDKIMFARQLIEDTIKRNASPIREIDTVGSNSSINSSFSEDVRLDSQNYSFSICHGDKRVMVLQGQDLELLKEAKVILEQFLPLKGGMHDPVKRHSSYNEFDSGFVASSSLIDESINTLNDSVVDEPKSTNSSKEVANDTSAETQIKNSHESKNESGGIKSSENNSPENSISVSKSSEVHKEARNSTPKRIKSALQGVYIWAGPPIEYTREFLMDLSSSKASLSYPTDWNKITVLCPGLPKTDSDTIDVASHQIKWNEYIQRSISLESLEAKKN